MKRIYRWLIYSTMMLCGSSVMLSAQKDILRPLEVRLGGGAGVSASLFSFVPTVRQSIHWGAYVSGLAKISNQRYTSMAIHLSYAQRGWREVYSNPLAYTFVRHLDFIEMSLLTNLHYPMKRVQIGIEIGPHAGYVISDRATATPTEETDAIRRRRHAYPLSTKWSWGLKGGPVMSMDFGRNRIELAAYFYFGLNSLLGTTVADDYGRAAEMSVTAGLAYYFQVI